MIYEYVGLPRGSDLAGIRLRVHLQTHMLMALIVMFTYRYNKRNSVTDFHIVDPRNRMSQVGYASHDILFLGLTI